MSPKYKRSDNDVDISLTEKAYGYISFSGLVIRKLIAFKKTYANSFRLLLERRKGKFPLEATLSNGEKIIVNNKAEINFIANMHGRTGLSFDRMSDIVTILPSNYFPVEGRKIKLFSAITNGDVISIFLDNEYRFLPVKDRTVIDIGTNIADSALYFYLRGASKVIAIEPLPMNYVIAKKNIEMNNLHDKITLLLAGCSGHSDYLHFEHLPQENSQKDTFPEDYVKNGRVPLLTLEDILVHNNIQDNETILKMDCEGYEYDTILSCTKNVLRRFKYMQIEYHSGYRSIKQKVQECGFEVTASKPMAIPIVYEPKSNMVSHYLKGEWQYLGYIFAQRR